MKPPFDLTRYLGSFLWIVNKGLLVVGEDVASAFGIDRLQARQGIDMAVFASLMHPDDRSAFTAATARASYYGGDIDAQFRFIAAGDVKHVKLTGSCVYADSGRPAEYLGALHISLDEEAPLGIVAAHLCAAAELAHQLDEPTVQKFLDMALVELGTRLAKLESELEKPGPNLAVIR